MATKLLKELHKEAKTDRNWLLQWVHSFSRYVHKRSQTQGPADQISAVLKTIPLLGKQLASKCHDVQNSKRLYWLFALLNQSNHVIHLFFSIFSIKYNVFLRIFSNYYIDIFGYLTMIYCLLGCPRHLSAIWQDSIKAYRALKHESGRRTLLQGGIREAISWRKIEDEMAGLIISAQAYSKTSKIMPSGDGKHSVYRDDLTFVMLHCHLVFFITRV